MYFTYIIESQSSKGYYVGSTQDLTNRIIEHNSGEGKYTRKGIPWRLLKYFEFESRSEAILFENKIKKRGIKRFLADFQIK